MIWFFYLIFVFFVLFVFLIDRGSYGVTCGVINLNNENEYHRLFLASALANDCDLYVKINNVTNTHIITELYSNQVMLGLGGQCINKPEILDDLVNAHYQSVINRMHNDNFETPKAHQPKKNNKRQKIRNHKRQSTKKSIAKNQTFVDNSINEQQLYAWGYNKMNNLPLDFHQKYAKKLVPLRGPWLALLIRGIKTVEYRKKSCFTQLRDKYVPFGFVKNKLNFKDKEYPTIIQKYDSEITEILKIGGCQPGCYNVIAHIQGLFYIFWFL